SPVFATNTRPVCSRAGASALALSRADAGALGAATASANSTVRKRIVTPSVLGAKDGREVGGDDPPRFGRHDRLAAGEVAAHRVVGVERDEFHVARVRD